MTRNKQKNRLVAPLLLTMALMTFSFPALQPVHAATAKPITVLLDGKPMQLDQQPILSKEGRVLVPFRAIFESLGAKVDYDPQSRVITATRGQNTITLQVEPHYVGAESDLGLLGLNGFPEVVNGHTLVSVRFLAESLGADISWDGTTQTVSISSKPLQLVTAIEQGDLAGVKKYLADGNSPNVRVAGTTAVSYALSFHEVDVAKALVNAGGTWERVQIGGSDHVNTKGRAQFVSSPAAVQALLPMMKQLQPAVINQMFQGVLNTQNTEVIDLLTQAGASIPEIEKESESFIDKNIFNFEFHEMALTGSLHQMKDLLIAGLDPQETYTLNFFGPYTKGPLLQAAAVMNRTDLIALLLQYGATLDATDRDGWTALMHAAAHGNTDAVKALVQAGAALNVSNTKGLTALDIATMHGNADTAQLLQAAGARHGSQATAVFEDAWNDSDPGLDLSELTELEKASYLGRTDEVKRLLAQADDKTRADALMEAGKGNNTETVRAILQSAPVTENMLSGISLENMFEMRNVEMLEAFLSAIDSLTLPTDEKTELRFYYATAAEVDDEEPMLQEMEKHGYQPLTHADGDSYTPLLFSIQDGNLDGLKLLLKNGNLPSEEPNALAMAVFYGQDQAAELLLQAGADPNRTVDALLPGNDMTPLMYAVKSSDADLVQALLQAGADVNAKTKDGTTALSLAMPRENQAIIQALQTAGATH